jgi:hypothetical protein
MDIEIISKISILAGILSSAVIIVHLLYHPQKMWIMNIVWPVTALYGSVFGLWLYFKIGQTKKMEHGAHNMNMHHSEAHTYITWQHIAKSTLHCGSGCFVGDVLSEILLFYITITVFTNPLFDRWLVNYIFAFLVGIVFQYYSIKPMKHLSSRDAIRASLKADSLSLTCWQIGMYGWMAVSIFLIFQHSLPADSWIFWFMMQIAMALGFFTACPVNAWLLKKGIKEPM